FPVVEEPTCRARARLEAPATAETPLAMQSEAKLVDRWPQDVCPQQSPSVSIVRQRLPNEVWVPDEKFNVENVTDHSRWPPTSRRVARRCGAGIVRRHQAWDRRDIGAKRPYDVRGTASPRSRGCSNPRLPSVRPAAPVGSAR